jgi:hypothetical protein
MIVNCWDVTPCTFATRMQNKSNTAIVNIFVDNSRLGSTITLPLINGLSDHDAQLFAINNIYAATKKVSLKQRIRIINRHSQISVITKTRNMSVCLSNSGF